MTYKDVYLPKNWNVICDICGWKIKASESRHRWDGRITCKKCWEPRHELDLFRAAGVEKGIPWSQPDSDGISVSPYDTLITGTGPSGDGTSNVVVSGYQATITTSLGDHTAGDGLTIFQTAFASAVRDDISVSNLGAGTELGTALGDVDYDGYHESLFDADVTAPRGVIWYADADLSLGSGEPLTCEMFFEMIEVNPNVNSQGKIFQLQFGNKTLDVYLYPYSGGINPLHFSTGTATHTTVDDAYASGITPGFHHIAMVYRTSNLMDVYYDGLRIITGDSFAGFATGQIQMGGSNTSGYSTRWTTRYYGGRVRRAEMYSGASFTPPSSSAAWGPP